MDFKFEYYAKEQFTMSLDIVDIGNACIRAFGDYVYKKIHYPAEYFIMTKTVAGMTGILSFGPVPLDMEDTLADVVLISFTKTEYKEPTIIKNINSFLNDPTKSIQKAEEIQPEELQAVLPNFTNYFNGEF